MLYLYLKILICPTDVWYDYYTVSMIDDIFNTPSISTMGDEKSVQGAQVLVSGQVISLNAPRDVINLHLRGGYILPAQKPGLNTMLR